MQRSCQIVTFVERFFTTRKLFSSTRFISTKNENPLLNGIVARFFHSPDDGGYPVWRPWGTNAEDEDVKSILQDPEHKKLTEEFFPIPGAGHRLFLIQPKIKSGPGRQRHTTVALQMDEAIALAETVQNWKVVEKIVTPSHNIQTKELFGSGNVEKLKGMICNKKHLSALFINVNRLTGIQQAKIEALFGLTVFDRYTVVLHIFKEHAMTKVSKLQVALAEVPCLRARLRLMKSSGHGIRDSGTRYIGGSGETFLELQKRLLLERETKLKHVLKKVKMQRDMHRVQREKKQIPVVAIVGYTNSGKTSLIKAFTGEKEMQPKNQLFATLDVTAHGGTLPNRMSVIFVDTVGFISNIPTELIASFSATLEDAVQADLIVHVWDVSHPDAYAQHICVMETLKELDIPQKVYDNIIDVGNKIDLVPNYKHNNETDMYLPISITSGIGLQDVLLRIEQKLMEMTDHSVRYFRVPSGGDASRWLYKEGAVKYTCPDKNDYQYIIMEVIMTKLNAAKFRREFGNLELRRVVKTEG